MHRGHCGNTEVTVIVVRKSPPVTHADHPGNTEVGGRGAGEAGGGRGGRRGELGGRRGRGHMYENNEQLTRQALTKLPSVLVNMYEEKMGTMGLNPQGDSEQLEMMGRP